LSGKKSTKNCKFRNSFCLLLLTEPAKIAKMETASVSKGRAMIDDPQELGTRVRQLRKARGWQTKELAARLGVRSSDVSKLERGKRKTVPVPLVHKLARAFEMSVEAFSEVADSQTPSLAHAQAHQELANFPASAVQHLVQFLQQCRKGECRGLVDAPQ
jgi:transcriptional regulator with XRE-family HTH domain